MSYICRRCRLESAIPSRIYNIPKKRGALSKAVHGDASKSRPSALRPNLRPPQAFPSKKWHNIKRWHTTSNISGQRTFHVAIIGSGPAGFYTALHLLKSALPLKISMYEALPVPFGLVRYGVAPDHPEVKNCQDRFEELAESPDFEFCGNLDVGGQVPLDVLRKHYDALVFTYGAGEDRKLGVPGEELDGVWSARSFVAWYNGLPGFSALDFGLERGEEAFIIGQGNVSLDVARLLLTHVDKLRHTDMPEHALEALSRNRIRHVSVVGRRGPLQAAFTIKELRELTTIDDVHFTPVDPSFFPTDLTALPRPRRRIAELLLKSSRTQPSPSATRSSKSLTLSFLLAPTHFHASASQNRLSSVTFTHQHFPTLPDSFSPTTNVLPTPTTSTQETSHAFRSIGYRSTLLPGLPAFDPSSAVLPNIGGRLLRGGRHDRGEAGAVVGAGAKAVGETGAGVGPRVGAADPGFIPGLYAAGWVKTGPTGVIASTMSDAFATAEAIVADLTASASAGETQGMGWDGVRSELEEQGIHTRRTRWEDWKEIDRVERERGARLGKPREKICHVSEMLALL